MPPSASIYRFCSSLNEDLHFLFCVLYGVFDLGQRSATCHLATGSEAGAVAHGQAILRAFVGRGLPEFLLYIASCVGISYPHLRFAQFSFADENNCQQVLRQVHVFDQALSLNQYFEYSNIDKNTIKQ